MTSNGEGTFKAAGDGQLYFHWVRPEQPRGIVLVVHGLGEHCGRYHFLIDALVKGQFSYYGYDQRGHGKSEGARGDIRQFREYTRDLEAFVQEIHEREAGTSGRSSRPRSDETRPQSRTRRLPVFLLGHSLGGVVAALYALDHQAELAGLVAASTAFKLVAPPHALSLAGSRLLSTLTPGFRVSNGLNPDDLSSDRAVVAEYLKDPLVQRNVTIRWTNQFFSTYHETLERAHELSLPLLVLQGSDDQIASAEGARAFFERVGSPDKTLRIYPELRHELFNESPPKRAEVFADLLSWLNKHVEVI